MNEGFIDLRQNQGSLLEDSFWPSFTDIMTVVVMIFLLATAILIVNNWELVSELQTSIEVEKQISQRLKESIDAERRTTSALQESLNQREQIKQKLQASIEAEQRISEAVKASTEINATLEEQLDNTQSQLSMLRLQLMQARESASARDRLIMDQQQEISLLTTEQKDLKRVVEAGKEKIAVLNQRVNQSVNTLNSLKSELELKNTVLENKQKELDLKAVALRNKQNELQESAVYLSRQQEELLAANRKNELQQKNLEAYEEQLARVQQQNLVLVGDYEKLEGKYNKLLRPSRSAIGKYVVEVKYEKSAGKEKILLKKSSKESYQRVTRAELHRQLKQLKETYKDTLYVKIIIPDNSGLSYNEAWDFMSGMLDKYDYYYQN